MQIRQRPGILVSSLADDGIQLSSCYNVILAFCRAILGNVGPKCREEMNYGYQYKYQRKGKKVVYLPRSWSYLSAFFKSWRNDLNSSGLP